MYKLIFIVIVIFFYSFRSYAQNEIIAILPFKAAGNVDSSTANAITEFAQNAFVKYSGYKIVERKQIQKVLYEQSFQLTGITEKAVEIGKILAVNKIATGSILKLGKEYTLIVDIIDVKTGEIFKTKKKSAQIEIEEINRVLIEPTIELMFSTKSRSNFTLTVKKGIGIKKMDGLSDTDAWVQVSIGDRFIGRTEKIQDNNSPEFNKSFEISDYAGELIILSVYDHDVSGEETIGQVTIPEPKSGLYQIIALIDGNKYDVGQIEIIIE